MSKTLWVIIGIILAINVIADYYMTDEALSREHFYETNKFSNIFGIQAHMLVVLGITLLLTIKAIEGLKPAKALLCLMAIVWTINNIYSINLLY